MQSISDLGVNFLHEFATIVWHCFVLHEILNYVWNAKCIIMQTWTSLMTNGIFLLIHWGLFHRGPTLWGNTMCVFYETGLWFQNSIKLY